MLGWVHVVAGSDRFGAGPRASRAKEGLRGRGGDHAHIILTNDVIVLQAFDGLIFVFVFVFVFRG